MSVIPVTVFFSLGLVFFFVALFLREQRRRLFASAERDSLLPLAAEQPRVAGQAEQDHEDHDHRGGPCGCRDGLRPPCTGCRKRAGRPATP